MYKVLQAVSILSGTMLYEEMHLICIEIEMQERAKISIKLLKLIKQGQKSELINEIINFPTLPLDPCAKVLAAQHSKV